MRKQWVLGVLVLVCAAFAARGWAEVGSLGDSNGQIAAWGDNSSGQLDIPSGTFTDIAAGGYHSLGILTDGTLAAWGDNSYGQLDVPSGTFTDIAAGDYYGLGIRSIDGWLRPWGSMGAFPAGTFTDVSARGPHALALHTDGTLVDWSLDYGQIDVPSGTFTDIAAGYYHSLGILTDGTLAGWNYDGAQIDVPSGTFADIAAGGYHSLGIREDGTLAGWGDNSAGQIDVPSGTFTDISAGEIHSLGLRTDGTLAGWGDNSAGQIDVPSGTFVAVEAGAYFGLALYARTSYDDLLVNGDGVADVASWLNRSITVAGSATVQSTMYTANDPVMAIAGSLTLDDGAAIVGDGVINAGGSLQLPAGAATVNGNLDLMAGWLYGSGDLTLDGGARLKVAPTALYNGAINVNSGSMFFNGTGWQTLSDLSLGSSGQVRVGPGQGVVASGTVDNAGSLQVTGNSTSAAQLEVHGAATNAASTGLISAHDASLHFTGGLDNQGSLALTGGTNDISGPINNTGTMTVTGGASAVFYDDLVQNGTMVVHKSGTIDSTAVLLGSFSGSGGFTGGGTVFVEGDLRPGNSPAGVLYDGDLVLGPGAHTLMELGGLTQGLEYDHIDITGLASLGGTLDVQTIDGFMPDLDDYFDLFDGELSGTFAALSLPALDAGLLWNLSRLYADGTIRVSAVPLPAAVLLGALGLASAGALLRKWS